MNKLNDIFLKKGNLKNIKHFEHHGSIIIILILYHNKILYIKTNLSRDHR